LLNRADLAHLYGDPASAKTWRKVASIAARMASRLNDPAKHSSAQAAAEANWRAQSCAVEEARWAKG
jgi:hypothetical protein